MTLALYVMMVMYGLAIGLLMYGFTKIKLFEPLGISPKTKFTIIVPFRDEAENLPLLLECFSKLKYPVNLFEVILVDDESKDSFQISDFHFNVSILMNIRVSNSPKKDAILTAMERVNTNWIVTTDADCVVHENWLLTLDNYIQQHQVSMIAGAVNYDCKKTFLHHFQQLDLASLQGATIGSFGLGKGFMCNGANLAYTKLFFQELDGFSGNDTLASGDDVFLLQKAIAQFPEKVCYLKAESNIVCTKPLNDWRSLFYQRVRWASKTVAYTSGLAKGLALVVFGGNVCWILALFCSILGWIPFLNSMCLLLIKFVVDSLLIYKSNRFLTKERMRFLILSSFVYPFFSTSVALYSLFGKYEWKGRKFKN